MMHTASQWEKIECKGMIPPGCFGHTTVKISKSKVVLFGGAEGTEGKFVMMENTYVYDIAKLEWSKLQGIFV